MHTSMDYLAIIETIIIKLKENNHVELAEQVSKYRDAASTGGELLSSITHILLDSIKTPAISNLIGKEVFELKRICNMNNIHVY